MNLAPDEDQVKIAEAARGYLAKELSLSRIRELLVDTDAAGLDDRTWGRSAELGWLSISQAEADGGLGMGLPGEVMLFRELGRHLTPGPFLPCVLAARAARIAGTHELADDIVSGRRRVGLRVGAVAVDLRSEDLLLCLDAQGADLVSVTGVRCTRGVDPTRPIVVPDVGGTVLSVSDSFLLSWARVLVAAELLGLVEAVRDKSASYAKNRIQFGRPIGSFQAVKHRCADMAIAAYSMTGEVFLAALLVEAGHKTGHFHAANAYSLGTRAAKVSAADNIQNHGGIGFTWESDAHLFLKRALLLEQILGAPRETMRAVLQPARHEF